MLRVGDKVPDFEARLATADGHRPWRFSEALGKGDVVIAFFPIAFSSTCTEQLCDARDGLRFWEHVGADVYGFSTDAQHVNVAYVRHERLGFPIISDPNRRVAERIWDLQTVSGVERCVKRGVMVVGPGGVVKHVWVTDDPDEWPGFDDVKRVLHAGHEH